MPEAPFDGRPMGPRCQCAPSNSLGACTYVNRTRAVRSAQVNPHNPSAPQPCTCQHLCATAPCTRLACAPCACCRRCLAMYSTGTCHVLPCTGGPPWGMVSILDSLALPRATPLGRGALSAPRFDPDHGADTARPYLSGSGQCDQRSQTNHLVDPTFCFCAQGR